MDLFEDLPETTKDKSRDDANGNQLMPEGEILGWKGSFQEEKTGIKTDASSLFADLPLEVAKSISPTKRKTPDEKIESFHRQRIRSSVKYKLKGFVADQRGERDEMQDAHIVCDNFHEEVAELHPSICRLSLYGVFDGHAGARASRYAAMHIRENLKRAFPKDDVDQVQKDIKKFFIDVFKKTDENFLQEATKSKPSLKDGTTAVVVLVINDVIYIANLGDSKAILCRYKEDLQKHIAVPLTVDHNPSSYEERIRIQKFGGFVRDGRMMGILEVSRSIGDGPYKNHGLTCLPDVKKCQLTEHDRFLIIACDGLWKSYTLEESINAVNKCLQNDSIEGTSSLSSEDAKYNSACQTLAKNAVLKLSGDNVTVLTVCITGSDSSFRGDN